MTDIFSVEFRNEQAHQAQKRLCSALTQLLLDMKPAVAEWICQYDFKKYFLRDVMCGVIISVILLPQGLSYASLADVEPTSGIYSGIFPALVYSLWGVSRQGAVGPMSIPALMSGVAIDEYVAHRGLPSRAIAVRRAVTNCCDCCCQIPRTQVSRRCRCLERLNAAHWCSGHNLAQRGTHCDLDWIAAPRIPAGLRFSARAEGVHSRRLFHHHPFCVQRRVGVCFLVAFSCRSNNTARTVAISHLDVL